MKDIKKIELKVGIVSLLGAIILISGIFLGRGYRISMKTTTIQIRFPNSGGLQVSSPVVVNGVKRGTVESVRNDNNTVLVEAKVDNTNDFRKDVRARISILEITGGKKVEIFPGQSIEPFDPKQEIPGEVAADFADILASLGIMLERGDKLLQQLDTTLTATNRILGDKKLLDKTNEIVTNTNEIISITRALLQENVNNINITLKNLREISSNLSKDYARYEPRFHLLISRLDTISTNLNIVLSNAQTSLETLDTLLNQSNSIVKQIRFGNNIVNKLIYDPEFSNRLDTTLVQLSDFVNLIRKYGVNVNLRIGTRP